MQNLSRLPARDNAFSFTLGAVLLCGVVGCAPEPSQLTVRSGEVPPYAQWYTESGKTWILHPPRDAVRQLAGDAFVDACERAFAERFQFCSGGSGCVGFKLYASGNNQISLSVDGECAGQLTPKEAFLSGGPDHESAKVIISQIAADVAPSVNP